MVSMLLKTCPCRDREKRKTIYTIVLFKSRSLLLSLIELTNQNYDITTNHQIINPILTLKGKIYEGNQ